MFTSRRGYGKITPGQQHEPVWRNGRRGRLKICFRKLSGGSSPFTGTNRTAGLRAGRSIGVSDPFSRFHHFLRTVIHYLIIEPIRVLEERGKTAQEGIELLQLLAYYNFNTYNNLSIG